MNRLIRNIFQGQLNRGLMVKVMGALLLDRTTRKNITWSTNEYEGYGQGFTAEDEISVNLICGHSTQTFEKCRFAGKADPGKGRSVYPCMGLQFAK